MSSLATQLGGAAVALDVNLLAATETVVLDSIDVQRFSRFTIYVTNSGGNNAIETFKLQTAPLVNGPWITVDSIDPGAIGVGVTSFESYADKSYKYIRVTATSANGSTASVYLSIGGLT